MNYEMVTLEAKTFYGYAVRTNNQAPDVQEQIGKLWKRAIQAFPKTHPLCCVYTNYTMNGDYDAIVCTEWEIPPEGMQRVDFPAGEYAKCIFQCDPHQQMGEVWQKIWESDLSRAYTSDLEVHLSAQGPVELYLAVAQFCQSCGMPMAGQQYGTQADGSQSKDYCAYCYQDGHFTADCTMEQMIEFCAAPMTAHHPEMSLEQAKIQMRAFFPKLKRWKED